MARKMTTARREALRDEAQEWDELSDEALAKLFDEGKSVQIRLRRPPPKTLTVALDEPVMNQLKREARRKQVPPRQLAAMWIAERLRGQESSGGGRR